MLPDYGKWSFSFRELLMLLGVIFSAGSAVGWLFFDSIPVGLAAGICCLPFLPKYRMWRMETRRWELLVQFRDLLYSIASSFSAGRNLTQALEEALTFWNGTYGEDDLIVQEVKSMHIRIKESNETDVEVLMEFAQRSGLPDIMDFAGVYETCKISGANLVQAVSRAASVIGDRIAMKQELHAVLAQKQFESRIVMASPFLLLFFLKLLSPEYLQPLHQSQEGRIISIAAVILIGAAGIMMERVTDIEL